MIYKGIIFQVHFSTLTSVNLPHPMPHVLIPGKSRTAQAREHEAELKQATRRWGARGFWWPNLNRDCHQTQHEIFRVSERFTDMGIPSPTFGNREAMKVGASPGPRLGLGTEMNISGFLVAAHGFAGESPYNVSPSTDKCWPGVCLSVCHAACWVTARGQERPGGGGETPSRRTWAGVAGREVGCEENGELIGNIMGINTLNQQQYGGFLKWWYPQIPQIHPF